MKKKLMRDSILYISLTFLLFACNSNPQQNADPEKSITAESDNLIDTLSIPETTIFGIDISHFQGEEIDFINKNQDKLSFIICKATEGITGIDPDFENNWTHIRTKGFVRGAYHFYHCDDDPESQASHFLSVIDTILLSDLPPIVDFEETSINNDCSITEIQDNLLRFLNLLEKKTGKKPLLYTDNNTANTHLSNPVFAGYRLWIADYRKEKQPVLPKAWAKSGWTLWQKTPNYHLGSDTNDLDIFFGDRNDFMRLLEGN